MPDYTAIPDATVDPDAPITSELFYRLRDNPLGMAAGEPGAPKISSDALSMRFASGSADGPGTGNVFTMLNLGRASGIFVNATVRMNAGSLSGCNLRYRTSTNNGSSWGGYTTLQSFENPSSTATNYGVYNGIVPISSGSNALQIQMESVGAAGGAVLGAFGLAIRSA